MLHLTWSQSPNAQCLFNPIMKTYLSEDSFLSTVNSNKTMSSYQEVQILTVLSVLWKCHWLFDSQTSPSSGHK